MAELKGERNMDVIIEDIKDIESNLLSRVVRLSEIAGVTEIDIGLDGNTVDKVSHLDFVRQLSAGSYFMNSSDGIQTYLDTKKGESLQNFLVTWYEEQLHTLHGQLKDLKNYQREFVINESGLRATIRENRLGASAMDRAIREAKQTMQELNSKQSQLQDAIVEQRDAKKKIDQDIDCTSKLCNELQRDNEDYLKESKRLEGLGQSMKRNEEMNQLLLRREMDVVSRKLERS